MPLSVVLVTETRRVGGGEWTRWKEGERERRECGGGAEREENVGREKLREAREKGEDMEGV